MSQVSVGFPWFVVSVFVVGFLPGLLLVIAGRRGKRIDDHPVCRGCAFDLFGTVEPIPDKHPKCPECGTRREPRIGNRQRRGKLALAGVLLMLTSIGVAGVWGYGRFGAAQIAQYKPMAMLRWEARVGTSNAADIAIGEMIARFQNGNLTAATADQLIADAVAHGPAGNPTLVNAPLGSRWDALAAELMKAGHGTDPQRIAIAKSWVELTPELRPKGRPETDIPLDIHRSIYGPPSPFNSNIQTAWLVIRHQGVERQMNFGGGGGGSATRGSGSGGGTSGTKLEWAKHVPADLKPGRHTIEIDLPITLADARNGPVWATWTQTSVVDFELVGPEGDVIGLIHDPPAAARMEQGFSVRNQQIELRRGGYSNVTLNFDDRPAPFAYQVYLLQRDGQRIPFCTVSSEASSGGLTASTGGKFPKEIEDGAVVDLVFEPDAEVARKTTNLTEILDHSFVVPGVKIVRPAKKPTP